MTYNIVTLGCKVNQYESKVMGENLNKSGYNQSENKNIADIFIINTCTVTSVSDSKNRKIIRKIKSNNPNSIIVLSGCMPQAYPEDYNIFNDCNIVIGNTNRNNITKYIDEYLKNKKQIIAIEKHKNKNAKFEKTSVESFGKRTRAFVKIQDGCNRFCSYCIIPYARGRVRSKPINELKDELKNLALNGYKEIVLVGINLSTYGEDINLNLYDAVKCASSIEGIKRVRLGSIEPELIQDYIEKFAEEEKFCPQFHLSLQSGSDNTLKRMNRQYTAKEYKKIVELIRKSFKNSSITTDIMVGFPGEDEKEFEESLAFADEIGFAKSHVFQYSRRKGTKADKFINQVDEETKAKRSKKMIKITNKSMKNFLNSQIGLVEEVLFETKDKNDYWTGYTKNYVQVKVKSKETLNGKIKNVKIGSVNNSFCYGNIV